jgi:N-acetylmuramoyl-L-alanine amidase
MNTRMRSASLYISHPWQGDNLPELFDSPIETITHETANPRAGADAMMHWGFVLSGGGTDEVSFHFANDDTRIVQIVRLGQGTWNASDGYYGKHNRRGIAIENCINLDGDFSLMISHLSWLLASLQQMPELFDWIPEYRTRTDIMDACASFLEVQHNQTAPDQKNCPRIIRSIPDLWNQIMGLANKNRVAFRIRTSDQRMTITARGSDSIIRANTVKDGDYNLDLTRDGTEIVARRLIRYKTKLAILTIWGTIIPLNAIRFPDFRVDGLNGAVTNDNWRTLLAQNIINPAFKIPARYDLALPSWKG